MSMAISPVEEDMKTRLAEELSKIRMVEAQEIPSSANLKEGTMEGGVADLVFPVLMSSKPLGFHSLQKRGLHSIMICI